MSDGKLLFIALYVKKMEIDLTPKMSSMLQSGIASYPGSSPAEKHVFFFAGEEPGCEASLGSSRWCDPPPFAMV